MDKFYFSGERCYTPFNRIGQCIPFQQCYSLLRIFEVDKSRSTISLLKQSQYNCGNRNYRGDPLLCCTDNPTRIDRQQTESPTVVVVVEEEEHSTQGPFILKPDTTQGPFILKPETTTKGPFILKPETTQGPFILKPETTTSTPFILRPTNPTNNVIDRWAFPTDQPQGRSSDCFGPDGEPGSCKRKF